MDNSRLPLIPVPLTGGNYLLWSRIMKTALCSRGLWSHITGPQTSPPSEGEEGVTENNPEEAKWFQEDMMILNTLQISLDPSILAAYSYCETAKELWETLKNVFGNTSNICRVFEIKKAISNLQQEGEFTKHFGEFKALWAELEELRPHTVDPKELQERRNQDQVFALLHTLKPENQDLVKHILRADKFPNINEVCMQIQKEEGSQRLFGRKDDLVFANKVNFRKNNRRGPAPICKHCKKPGHTQAQCWALHPHKRPDWYDPEKAIPKKWPSKTDTGRAMASTTRQTTAKEDILKKSDLEALIKQSKELEVKQSDRAATLRYILEGLGLIQGGMSNKPTRTESEPDHGRPDAAKAKGEPRQDVEIPQEDLDEVLEENKETRPEQPTIPRRSSRLNKEGKRGPRKNERLKKTPTVCYNYKAVATPIQAVCPSAHVKNAFLQGEPEENSKKNKDELPWHSKQEDELTWCSDEIPLRNEKQKDEQPWHSKNQRDELTWLKATNLRNCKASLLDLHML